MAYVYQGSEWQACKMVLQASAFDFLIEHRKGSDAHMLSRVVEEVEVEDNDGILGFETTE